MAARTPSPEGSPEVDFVSGCAVAHCTTFAHQHASRRAPFVDQSREQERQGLQPDLPSSDQRAPLLPLRLPTFLPPASYRNQSSRSKRFWDRSGKCGRARRDWAVLDSVEFSLLRRPPTRSGRRLRILQSRTVAQHRSRPSRPSRLPLSRPHHRSKISTALQVALSSRQRCRNRQYEKARLCSIVSHNRSSAPHRRLRKTSHPRTPLRLRLRRLSCTAVKARL